MNSSWLSLSQRVALYKTEAEMDLKTLWRTPGFILPCLAFPVLFYLLFGVMLSKGQHAEYLLVSYAAFGVMGPALFNFGANVATERAQGWLTLKQISPAPIGSWLFGKTLSCLLLALLIILLLFVCAGAIAGVRLYTSQWLQLAGVLLLGTIPFCLLGLTLGLTLSSKSAPATINLIYLPLAFLGGLWLPLQLLPTALQQLALVLPSYHLGQLGYAVISKDRGEPFWVNVAVLVAYSLVLIWLATRRFRAQSHDRR